MELNREQIVKAMECCYMQELDHNENCPECPYTAKYVHCGEHLGKDALALIRELTKENEGLTELLDARCDRCIERERADTVRKMQERLHENFHDRDKVAYTRNYIHYVIDQIAKEMLEEWT